MKKAILALAIGLLALIFLIRFLSFYPIEKNDYPVEQTKIISWKEAHNYYGQYVTVEGEVVKTHNSGKACFLNFHGNWKRYFTAVIFAEDFNKFPEDPEKYYNLKTIQVTGLVKEYRGKPEIIIKNPSQIKIIRENIKVD